MLSLKFKVWDSNSDVWSSKSVRSLKSEVWNSKSEVQNPKSGRGPKSEVGVWHLKSVRSLSEVCHKSENCLKSVWSGLHDSDHHWFSWSSQTYIITHFLSLFGHIYVCLSLLCDKWIVRVFESEVWRLYDVWQWRPQSDVWSMSKVHNLKSENWCVKSTIGSLMYEVWRNLKFDVRHLSENCLKYVQSLKYYVCLFKT